MKSSLKKRYKEIMGNPNNTFCEVDINYLLDAVNQKIRTTKWNVDDQADWEILTALKDLQTRLRRALDDE